MRKRQSRLQPVAREHRAFWRESLCSARPGEPFSDQAASTTELAPKRAVFPDQRANSHFSKDFLSPPCLSPGSQDIGTDSVLPGRAIQLSLETATCEALENLDWTSTEPEQLLWPAVLPAVRRNHRFWRNLARKHGLETDRLLRNLVATSEKSDLDLVRIILRWRAAIPKLPESRISAQLLTHIPKRRSPGGLLEKLLFGDTVISLGALHDHGVGDAELFSRLYPRLLTTGRTAAPKRLAQLIRRFRRWRLDESILLEVMSNLDLEPLDETELSELTPIQYGQIIRVQATRSTLLQRPLANRINENPALWTGTVEWEQHESFKQEIRKLLKELGSLADSGEAEHLSRVALRQLLVAARSSENLSFLTLVLRVILAAGPARAASAIATSPDPGDFDRDWQALTTRPELREGYLAAAALGESSIILQQAAESMSDDFLDFLADVSFETLTRVVRKLPDAFAPALLRGLNGKQILHRARADEEIARIIENHVPATERWAHLQLASEVAQSPYYKVAYEVGLAFAPTCIPHLLRLARHWANRRDALSENSSPFDDLYHTYSLPKKAGGNRTITAPDPSLKYLQRRLMKNGFGAIALADSAHGFRPEYSILTNAQLHVHRPLVVNVDIRRFFESTSRDLIFRATKDLASGQLSPRARQFVTDLCTYAGALPTGAPTSPYIGNIVLRRVDHAIETVCERHGVHYSRYADDLTLSGGDAARDLLPFVRQALDEIGYSLDSKKTQLYRRGRRQVVTGVVVNDRANLPRRVRRKLRAALHHRENGDAPHWRDRPLSDDALRGHLAYWRMFDPEHAPVLAPTTSNNSTGTSRASDE